MDVGKCGQFGTSRHILSACPMGLSPQPSAEGHCECYEVRRVNEISLAKLSLEEYKCQGRVSLKGVTKPPPMTQVVDERWQGLWHVAPADLDNSLVFPTVTTSQHPDLLVWS